MKHLSTAMLLAAALLCTLTVAHAQYNRTWDYGMAIDIVDAGNGNVTTLATDASADIILAEHDFFGNINFRTYHNLSLGQSGEEFRPTKMVFTPNGEYVVVGIYSYLQGGLDIDYAPFAARFDSRGIMLWVNVYDASSLPGRPMPQGYSRANVVYVADDPANESYIITTPSDPQDDVVYHNDHHTDVVIHALRIDALGAPIWNNKYKLDPAIRPVNPTYNNYYSMESYPQALTYYTEGGGGGRYFIGGSTVTWYYGGVTTGSFFMSIDRNGAIDHSYARINETATGGPFGAWDNNAVYDANTQEVVMVSTAYNSTGLGTSASAIYVTRFGSALAINSCNFYQDPNNFSENYVKDISLDVSGNNYVIAAWVFDQGSTVGSAALLKLDKITMLPAFYNRYNISHATNSAAVVCHTDMGGTIENYTMHGNTEPSTVDSRLFNTDVNGDDFCSFNPLNPIQGTIALTPANDPFVVVNVIGDAGVNVWQPQLTTTDYFCGTHYFKKGNTATSLEELPTTAAMECYPSLISEASEQMTLSLEAEEETNVLLTLYNAEGKLIYQRNYELDAGPNQLTWQQEFDTPGLYFLKVNSDTPALNQTFRLARE